MRVQEGTPGLWAGDRKDRSWLCAPQFPGTRLQPQSTHLRSPQRTRECLHCRGHVRKYTDCPCPLCSNVSWECLSFLLMVLTTQIYCLIILGQITVGWNQRGYQGWVPFWSIRVLNFSASRGCLQALPDGIVVKNLPVNVGDTGDAGSIPGSDISPGIENGNRF